MPGHLSRSSTTSALHSSRLRACQGRISSVERPFVALSMTYTKRSSPSSLETYFQWKWVPRNDALSSLRAGQEQVSQRLSQRLALTGPKKQSCKTLRSLSWFDFVAFLEKASLPLKISLAFIAHRLPLSHPWSRMFRKPEEKVFASLLMVLTSTEMYSGVTTSSVSLLMERNYPTLASTCSLVLLDRIGCEIQRDSLTTSKSLDSWRMRFTNISPTTMKMLLPRQTHFGSIFKIIRILLECATSLFILPWLFFCMILVLNTSQTLRPIFMTSLSSTLSIVPSNVTWMLMMLMTLSFTPLNRYLSKGGTSLRVCAS